MAEKPSSTITTISELLAAISIVASGATYVYQNWWKDQVVDLSAHVASSTPKMLSILATNTGGQDVAIVSASVSSYWSSEQHVTKLKIREGGELIRKGDSLLLTPTPSDLSIAVQTNKKKYKSDDSMAKTLCTADIEYVGPKGTIRSIQVPFECYALCIADFPEK